MVRAAALIYEAVGPHLEDVEFGGAGSFAVRGEEVERAGDGECVIRGDGEEERWSGIGDVFYFASAIDDGREIRAGFGGAEERFGRDDAARGEANHAEAIGANRKFGGAGMKESE